MFSLYENERTQLDNIFFDNGGIMYVCSSTKLEAIGRCEKALCILLFWVNHTKRRGVFFCILQ
jgi:hypothetical protein